MNRAVGTAVLFALLNISVPALRAQVVVPAKKSPQAKGKAARLAPKPAPSAGDAVKAPDAEEEATPAPRPGGMRMSRAVVCKSIEGYEDYKPLPGASQTSDEKLLIYYRPLRYKTEYVDGFYRAHLVQDNEIRKRGRKEVVRQKRKVVEYQPKQKDPLTPIFIRNTISLKGLMPGDYDLTIILHDELDKSAPPTKQVVRFRVTPPVDPRSATKEVSPPAPAEKDPAPRSSDPFPEGGPG